MSQFRDFTDDRPPRTERAPRQSSTGQPSDSSVTFVECVLPSDGAFDRRDEILVPRPHRQPPWSRAPVSDPCATHGVLEEGFTLPWLRDLRSPLNDDEPVEDLLDRQARLIEELYAATKNAKRK